MAQQHLVDLARPDLFPAAVDQFFDAPGECQITVGVQESLVAGPEPTVGERFRISLRIVLVAGNHVRALNHDLAAYTPGKQVSLFVHDADLDARSRTYRAWLAL